MTFYERETNTDFETDLAASKCVCRVWQSASQTRRTTSGVTLYGVNPKSRPALKPVGQLLGRYGLSITTSHSHGRLPRAI